MLVIILLVFAFVMFVVSGAVQVEPWRWRLLVWGLACLVAATLFGHAITPLR